jgi:hypothetical protein
MEWFGVGLLTNDNVGAVVLALANLTKPDTEIPLQSSRKFEKT